MNTVPIFFAFDRNMLMPAGVCITSLMENALPDTFYDIFILHGRDECFSESELSLLPQKYGNCHITFREVGNDFSDCHVIRGITTATYFRLIAPEVIPEYDKIIYSDVDVIFRDDLTSFYKLDLSGYYLAGVDNGSALRKDARDYIEGVLGLDSRKGYYYAGNIILNSALMLKDNIVEEFRRLSNNEYEQQDMDIMNIACNGRIKPIGLSFCLTNYLYDLVVTRRDEMEKVYGSEEINYALKRGIVHYNGPKPWKELCLNMDIWWDYYRRSIFFDERFCLTFWSNHPSLLMELPRMKRIKALIKSLLPGLFHLQGKA